MDFAVVQQDDEMAAYLTQQVTKEHGHFFALNIVLIELAVERTMKSFGADGDAGDGGDTIMAIMIRACNDITCLFG